MKGKNTVGKMYHSSGYTTFHRYSSMWFTLLIAAVCCGYASEDSSAAFPYHLEMRDLVMITAGVTVFGAGVLFEHMQKGDHHLSRADFNSSDVPAFDRVATTLRNPFIDRAGDIVLGGLLLSVPFATGYPEFRNGRWLNLLTLATMYSETFFYSYALCTWSKVLTSRHRPYLYNKNLSSATWQEIAATADARRSFFSRHATLAFSTALFFNTTAGDLFGRELPIRLLQAASLTIATGVGISRVAAGKHFPSDVVTGALTGACIGILVPLKHRNQSEYAVSFSGNGFTVSWELH